MSKNGSRKQIIGRVIGNEESTNRFSVFNQIVMAYVGLVLLCFTLYTIAPFVTFIGKTPFYSSKSYLGILGGVLLCIDLVTNKVLWRGPYVILLYGISLIAIISSVLTISYGVSENLFLICWTVVQFALVYSCAQRTDRETFRKYAISLFGVLLVIWVLACLVSLAQYALQIGYQYVADPRSDDASLVRQGFWENRLFGIFNPLNHAVYISLMLMLGCLYCILKTHKKFVRVLLSLSATVFFLHILLSGSRSAAISMWVCVLIIVWSITWSKCKKNGFKKVLVACGMAVAVGLCCIPAYKALKNFSAKVPYWTKQIQIQFCGDHVDVNVPVDDVTNLTGPGTDDTLLEREGLDEDISNDRFKIWIDYLSLYKEIGLFGLSPGNYMVYIQENNPELYIAEYVRENFPSKYNAGVIYHVHNGYLMVFVSTGIIGLLLLLAFIVLCVGRCLSWIRSSETLSSEFVILLCVVVAGAISAVFDKGIFFVDSAPTFFFWFALGILMKITAKQSPKSEK